MLAGVLQDVITQIIGVKLNFASSFRDRFLAKQTDNSQHRANNRHSCGQGGTDAGHNAAAGQQRHAITKARANATQQAKIRKRSARRAQPQTKAGPGP